MINVAICDDEKYILDKIEKLVFNFFHRKNVEITVSQFGSGEELLRCNNDIDILFLDIQMDGIDGMETARKLRSQNYKGYLIFITVLKEMVFQSFEVQAYDYLIKPINEECFEKTMGRLYASMQNANDASLLIQRGYRRSQRKKLKNVRQIQMMSTERLRNSRRKRNSLNSRSKLRQVMKRR